MVALPAASSPDAEAGPSKRVCLDAHEVTVAEYARCVGEKRCSEPEPYDLDRSKPYHGFCNWRHSEARDRHPINCVSYQQAKAYCAQRGARLPSDVEWQWAASNAGTTGYPWGDEPPRAELLNGCSSECPRAVMALTQRKEMKALYPGDDGFGGTAPVGSFPRGDNRHGIHDLAGNVVELVEPEAAPDSPGDLTVGGSFLTQTMSMHSAAVTTRTAWSGAVGPDMGFRCAADGG